MNMKEKKKMVAGILLIIMLGIVSINIPMLALAFLGEKTIAARVQYPVMSEPDEQPNTENVDPDSSIVEVGNLTAVHTQAVKQPVVDQVDQAATPSRSSTRRHSHNLDSLARLVHGEARGESFAGQVAVAAVVLNRIESDKFGNTVNEVIFEPGAFTAVSDGQYYLQPDQEAYKAAQAALDGWDPTDNAIYYWNPVTATNKWIWNRPITARIGKHVFAH